MLRIAVPVVVAEIGWIAMGVVDVMMVGRIDAESIGAVSVGRAVFMLVAIAGIGLLLGLDTLIAQANQTWSYTALKLIDLSGGKSEQRVVMGEGVAQESPRREVASAKLAWLYEWDQPGADSRSLAGCRSTENAVDRLLAT